MENIVEFKFKRTSENFTNTETVLKKQKTNDGKELVNDNLVIFKDKGDSHAVEIIKKETAVKTEPGTLMPDCVDIAPEQNTVIKMEMGSTNVIEESDDTGNKQRSSENVDPFQEMKSNSSKKVAKQRHQIETDVGITEFIGKHNGFNGILKHRYSDFIVNEITKENKIVELTSFDLPPEGPKTEKDALKNLIPDDKILEIENLANELNDKKVIIKANDIDKNTRTKIHSCIKDNYITLTSATDFVNDERLITIRQISNQRKQERKSWPRYRPNFTHFVMYKENTDTLQAINFISNMLRIKPGEFNYAGTKDKRGKTSQMVSVKRVEGERLMQLNKGLRRISLGNICYKDFQLKLGDLGGNRFTIILREIDGSDVELISALDSFRDKGFINYYGMQRFGTTEISTHSVGRALILQKWQEAIDLILMPRAGDGEYLNACRRIWSETKNARRAFNALSRKDSIEGQLLNGLMKHQPNDLVNALNNIPRNMRLMYIHSFQSYIWNSVVSKRIAQFGLEPKVGDLYQKGQPTYTIRADCNKVKVVEDTNPRIVTQEDIDDKKVTIYDVVLPLPGHSVIYPTNEAAEWFKEILAKDDMDLESFVSRVKSYSLSGSYRHLIVKPKNFSYTVLTYGEKNEDLCLSDWDKLMGNELKIKESDKYKALKLIFDLDSSTYATMAIREITKRDTSVWVQRDV